MRLQDLPVVVDLPGRLGEEVAAFVEVEAGWQVVSATGPPTPVLELTTAPRAGRPCVVVVECPVQAEEVREALLGGALDVIAWPDDRARLLEAPLRAHATHRNGSGPPVLRIAGCAGGVGTSTVALAVGGLLAWSGRATLVVGDDDLLRLCGLGPWSGPGASELGQLGAAGAASEVASLARPVPGIDGLAVLGGSGEAIGGAPGWPVQAVVVDLRAPRHLAGADLVCARPDAGLGGLDGQPADLPVLVLGDGPLDQAGVRRRLGRPPVAWLPESVRVARAGVAGRVPAGLPGAWLAALRSALGGVWP
ncbi:MAG: hypothetical protein ACRDYX_18620 [Egibacteraceae bacterium]